jgi:hypothetical protein
VAPPGPVPTTIASQFLFAALAASIGVPPYRFYIERSKSRIAAAPACQAGFLSHRFDQKLRRLTLVIPAQEGVDFLLL